VKYGNVLIDRKKHMASSFRFTTHALDELKERQIAKSIVLKVLDEQTDPFAVVTAYRTSKIDKYWSKT
jgi:hypothetical protein